MSPSLPTLQKHLHIDHAASYGGENSTKHANEFGFKKIYDQAKDTLSSIANAVIPYVPTHREWGSGWMIEDAVHYLK